VDSDNVNRKHAKQLISLFPGVHLRKLSRYLGVSLSTARYHLVGLQRDGEIFCRKEGEYLRAYPLWADDERSRRVYAVLHQKTVRKILHIMLTEHDVKEPPQTNSWISNTARLSQSTVSEYLGVLRDLQLVRKIGAKDGHPTFEIVSEERGLLSTILALYDKNFISEATDNYINLWEF
jgi:predicted transcriptional regulator